MAENDRKRQGRQVPNAGHELILVLPMSCKLLSVSAVRTNILEFQRSTLDLLLSCLVTR